MRKFDWRPFISMLKVAVIVGGIVIAYWDVSEEFTLSFVLLLLLIFVFRKGIANLYKRSALEEAKSIDKLRFGESYLSQEEDIILYLRSFVSDEDIEINFSIRSGIKRSDTYETMLAVGFGEIGNLVTLNNVSLNYVGVTKVENTEENWQEIVFRLATKSKFIIWSMGFTKSVLWELDYLVKNNFSDKTIIFLPIDSVHAADRNIVWKGFLQSMEEFGDFEMSLLPKEIGMSLFLNFENGRFQPVDVTPKLFSKILFVGGPDPLLTNLRRTIKKMGGGIHSLLDHYALNFLLVDFVIGLATLFPLFFALIFALLGKLKEASEWIAPERLALSAAFCAINYILFTFIRRKIKYSLVKFVTAIVAAFDFKLFLTYLELTSILCGVLLISEDLAVLVALTPMFILVVFLTLLYRSLNGDIKLRRKTDVKPLIRSLFNNEHCNTTVEFNVLRKYL